MNYPATSLFCSTACVELGLSINSVPYEPKKLNTISYREWDRRSYRNTAGSHLKEEDKNSAIFQTVYSE